MKIFVAVGTLFPFDRLIVTIDEWTVNQNNIKVIAQIGNSSYVPKQMEFYKSLPSSKFNKAFSEADLVICHAGMGVVLKALVESKPIIILPRRLELGEHTTDHQMATARALKNMDYVNVAMDEKELLHYLEKPENISSKGKINEYASESLIDALRKFIESS